MAAKIGIEITSDDIARILGVSGTHGHQFNLEDSKKGRGHGAMARHGNPHGCRKPTFGMRVIPNPHNSIDYPRSGTGKSEAESHNIVVYF